MPKKSINAKEILADIKAGIDDTALMEKYGLTEKGLQSLFRKLVDAGALKQELLENRNFKSEKGIEYLWKCPACGKPQMKQADECPDCGVIVAKFRQAPAKAELDDTQGRKIVEEEKTGEYFWKCSECGKSQPKPFDQCPECRAIESGVKTPQSSEQTEEIKGSEIQEVPRKSGRRTAAIAGAWVIALIVMVFFGVQKCTEESSEPGPINPKLSTIGMPKAIGNLKLGLDLKAVVDQVGAKEVVFEETSGYDLEMEQHVFFKNLAAKKGAVCIGGTKLKEKTVQVHALTKMKLEGGGVERIIGELGACPATCNLLFSYDKLIWFKVEFAGDHRCEEQQEGMSRGFFTKWGKYYNRVEEYYFVPRWATYITDGESAVVFDTLCKWIVFHDIEQLDSIARTNGMAIVAEEIEKEKRIDNFGNSVK